MIHITEARRELVKGVPCQLKFWKKSTGEKVEAKECVCTSSNFERNTVNLKFLPSEEIRKIRVVTIFELNGEEVVL